MEKWPKWLVWTIGIGTCLALSIGVFYWLAGNNEPAVAEKSPMETELERRLIEVVTRKDMAVRKDITDSLRAVRQELGEVKDNVDTLKSIVLDIRTELRSHNHGKNTFVEIPDRASLPKIQPASRSASVQRSTSSDRVNNQIANTRLVSARTAPAVSQNSGDFVTRQEFERRNDSVNYQISGIRNLSLATAIAVDTALARINRLTGTPNAQAPDSARTNSSIGSLVRPRTEAPPAVSTGGTRHAY